MNRYEEFKQDVLDYVNGPTALTGDDFQLITKRFLDENDEVQRVLTGMVCGDWIPNSSVSVEAFVRARKVFVGLVPAISCQATKRFFSTCAAYLAARVLGDSY